ncbi:MAG TPA: hypothetical protein VNJ07_06770 [Chitinophagales bacterium]|nr:hypothetical protein [Chitinophagales bacterium]
MLNEKQHVTHSLLICITIFSIAMAFVESAVVVYLRVIYYPDGFAFPLTPISPDMAATEFFREAATIVMLASIGVLAGKTFTQKFAWFLYSFAVWDIFYYVFLKVLLDWPHSLLTWDILFLIPVPWVGPVITPVIAAGTMIALALCLLFFRERLSLKEVSLLAIGALVLILAWIWDYSAFVLAKNTISELWSLAKDDLFSHTREYVPQHFNWLLFAVGELLCIAAIGIYCRRVMK